MEENTTEAANQQQTPTKPVGGVAAGTNRELSLEEKATNWETMQHINLVMAYLAHVQCLIAERMFSHDRSKLADPEVATFTRVTPLLRGSTYGSPEYYERLAEMKGALSHHYAHNRHHPQFFGEKGIEGMNLIDLIEYLVDCVAASKRHADGDPLASMDINKGRFGISDQLDSILRNTIPLIVNPYVEDQALL